MTIPEVASRRQDHHFEDWLAATLIENTNRELPDANESCVPGITDLWMLEIAERNGRMWTGKFHVEFENGAQEWLMDHHPSEVGTGMLFFARHGYGRDAVRLRRKERVHALFRTIF